MNQIKPPENIAEHGYAPSGMSQWWLIKEVGESLAKREPHEAIVRIARAWEIDLTRPLDPGPDE